MDPPILSDLLNLSLENVLLRETHSLLLWNQYLLNLMKRHSAQQDTLLPSSVKKWKEEELEEEIQSAADLHHHLGYHHLHHVGHHLGLGHLHHQQTVTEEIRVCQLLAVNHCPTWAVGKKHQKGVHLHQ